MEYITVFTKGLKAYKEAPALLIPRLKAAGCEIVDEEVMFLTHEQCAVHYQKLVGGPYYEETESIFDTCPSRFFRIYGDVDVVKSIVGEETDPRDCSETTVRYILGTGKGDNILHRSADSKEAEDDDKRFWDPETGFVSQFRRNPSERQRVEEWLHNHDLAV